jgi:ribosomal protein S19
MSFTIAWKLVYIVKASGAIVSADLGNSSNYSNEIQYARRRPTMQPNCVCKALKIVVGKVFLRLAIMQELVGPK